ncbi:pentatricopeptide repeat-containing protein At3g22670, mitochondrial [Dioscorea cayenensis subsp. rotundata]|uniref:Pentatricopeptide repeat-containing protein At3g22670, mitochondrial n=1 Tax=Dioscorea cayennensis subsp. rotundata TaxID=55577 RepID=A0AB40AWC4_DIOCR|nr:pentatricopeptide repeat-containing protein At3g22670, mitochondrial [Dioscorea cayenensis subsp. rotundata]
MAPFCGALLAASFYGIKDLKSRMILLKFRGLCCLVEPHELPAWFKIPASRPMTLISDSDDDFVIPAESQSLVTSVNTRKANGFMTDVRKDPPCEIVVDDDVDEISNVLKKRFSSPETVCLALDACSVKVSKSLIDKILRRFNNNWISAFGFFKWVDNQPEFNNKQFPKSYDMMVDILGKCKKFDLMLQLVEEMNHIGGLVSLSTMAKVIRRFSGARRWHDAIKTFYDLELFGVKKDCSAFNVLLDSLCKERNVKCARDVFLLMRSHIPPNASSFNILLHGWCKARKLDEAKQVIKEMRDFGFTPCVISYTNLIEAYCIQKDFENANAILAEMRSQGCLPTVVTYTIIMHSLGKANKIQEALQVPVKMSRDGCTPDTSFYNSLIYILCKAGRLADANRLFEEMHRDGVPPNAITYSTLISAFCDYSQEEDAFKLITKMGESPCKPDVKTYHPLLKLCCKRKWTKLLMYLLVDMFEKDISLDPGTYTMLVQGLCQNGKLQQSCLFFEEMVLKGIAARPRTLNLLLEGLEKKGIYGAKEKIHQLMLQTRSRR